MVWPNFFLMNVSFALKGSKLFNIIEYTHTCTKILTKFHASSKTRRMKKKFFYQHENWKQFNYINVEKVMNLVINKNEF